MKDMKEKLAIKGHPTRGEEVIEILEMLGGKISYECNYKDGFDGSYIFFINTNENFNIDGVSLCNKEELKNYYIFTLEEFFEKFPYKVGDKVKYMNDIFHIKSLQWDSENNTVIYYIDADWSAGYAVKTNDLQPYKEETKTMEGVYAYNEINCYHQEFGDKVKIRLGNDYEIKVEDEITYIIKKQSNKYPKTYEECCKVLKIQTDGGIALVGKWCMEDDYIPQHLEILRTFSKLLICRDAYWKIAGEEMGLGKPWKPDWSTEYECKYVIEVYRNNLRTNSQGYSNTILAFPTIEMRDSFYENFKELIEKCKVLL